MMVKKSKIDCPIFKEKEWTIEQLTRDLNSAKKPADKLELATRLKGEVQNLIECRKKEGGNPACKACQFLANTRTEMANIIIRVSKLKGAG